MSQLPTRRNLSYYPDSRTTRFHSQNPALGKRPLQSRIEHSPEANGVHRGSNGQSVYPRPTGFKKVNRGPLHPR